MEGRSGFKRETLSPLGLREAWLRVCLHVPAPGSLSLEQVCLFSVTDLISFAPCPYSVFRVRLKPNCPWLNTASVELVDYSHTRQLRRYTLSSDNRIFFSAPLLLDGSIVFALRFRVSLSEELGPIHNLVSEAVTLPAIGLASHPLATFR